MSLPSEDCPKQICRWCEGSLPESSDTASSGDSFWLKSVPFVLGAQKQMDYRAIPRAVFTDPEIGTVGLTEADADAQGIACRCQTLDLSFVPKALAIRETRGVVNMVIARESHKILGVHLIAPRGADIIHEAALAVKFGLTIEDLIETIHVYPTMSEAIRMVAQMFVKDVSKLSCCAE